MAEPYRVGVTASRDWTDRTSVWEALALAGMQCRSDQMTVIHGGCGKGGDLHAHQWCEKYPALGNGVYVVEEVHRADWSRGKAGGPWRNRRMVDRGADAWLAFIMPCTPPGCRNPEPHGSHGASGCADLAEKAGIDVRRFTA